MKLRYTGPIDEIDLPFGGTVKQGHQFEVTEEQGRGLLMQSDIYALAGDDEGVFDAMTVPELKQYAEDHDVGLGDATKKADIIAAIKKG